MKQVIINGIIITAVFWAGFAAAGFMPYNATECFDQHIAAGGLY